MESIINLDISLFQWINGSLSNPFFDLILIPIRNKAFWIPFYVFILSFIVFNRKLIPKISILFLILTVSVSDFTSSKLIKNTVERPRPCHELSGVDYVNLKVHCGGGYSFTSSHATNHFAVGSFLFFLLGGFLKKYKYLLLIWAGLISFAQVYVGVHFPIDVTCGGLLGFAIGYLMFIVFKRMSNYKTEGHLIT